MKGEGPEKYITNQGSLEYDRQHGWSATYISDSSDLYYSAEQIMRAVADPNYCTNWGIKLLEFLQLNTDHIFATWGRGSVYK